MTPTLTLLGIALFGNLLCGIVGFAIGRVTKRGPTRTVEVYEGDGVPF